MVTTASKFAIPGSDRVLNERLANTQGLDDADIAILRELHARMDALMRSLLEAELPRLREAVGEIEALECEMQKAWKFDENRSFHTHWLRVPGCRCRSVLNMGFWGQGVRFVAVNCPVHQDMQAPEGVLVVRDDKTLHFR